MQPQELLQIIKSRRNTKHFSDKKVDKSYIDMILKSAVWAPNHRSTEPWRFVVVTKSSPIKENISNFSLAWVIRALLSLAQLVIKPEQLQLGD